MQTIINQKVSELLEKYFDGETTLQEEQQLRDYFNSTDLESMPEELRGHAPQFLFFAQQKREMDALPEEKRVKRALIHRIIIAASVAAALIAGLFIYKGITSDNQSIRLVINGVRLNDRAVAVEIADNQMQKVSKMIQKFNQSAQKVTINGNNSAFAKLQNIAANYDNNNIQ